MAKRHLDIAARVHAYVPEHNAGAETMLHSMLRALVARGHRCTAWLARYSAARESYEIDGVRVVPARARVDGTWTKADVLISHLENVDPTAAIAKGYGIPYVILAHNTFYPTKKSIDEAHPALVVYNSEWMRDELGDNPNGIVINPSVDVAEYATKPGDAVTIVNATATKGAEVFYELAKRFPDTPFLAVGGAYGVQLGSELPNVEQIPHVPFNRMRDEVYSRSKVLLMPSDYESWGRVGTEAMCSGIPVIAHPTPGLKENLGDAGIFVDRADVDRWEKALKTLLGNEKTYAKASENALKRAAELDADADLDRWCDAIESLARKGES
jgi:glycosyltransferase involved in cell wall biosynthesis